MLQLQRALREVAGHLRGDTHLLALGVHANRHRTIRRGGLRLCQPCRNRSSTTVLEVKKQAMAAGRASDMAAVSGGNGVP